MSIPSFIFGIWISTICVVGMILLCGVFGMVLHDAGKWTLHRLRHRLLHRRSALPLRNATERTQLVESVLRSYLIRTR